MATQSSGAFSDLGKHEDLYYTDPDNCKVESIPLEYNTRFSQDFSNKSSGTSVFIIPPGNGLKHVVITLGYRASSINNQTGEYALPRGWGYQALEQVSFRIGGSSQYFMTGAQVLAKAIRTVRTQTQADALLSLGGNECKTAADFDQDQFAYVVIPIWCLPSSDGLSVPLPADTLAQQVQVTAQLRPSSAFWIASSSIAAPSPPVSLDVATFMVEQLTMVDRGMAISNHVDLNSHELLMPVGFDQQELQVPIAAAAAVGGVLPSQSITLTGFRSGQVKAIQLWLTKDSDPVNAGLWYAPSAVTVLYAGTIYSQYQNGVGALMNLLDGTKPSAVNHSELEINGTQDGFVSTPTLSEYITLPFGNPTGNDYEAEVLTHGKPILNGLVNLQLTPPSADAYTCHIAYIYNATLVFSRSSCEFRF
jgi:hypothetical protein